MLHNRIYYRLKPYLPWRLRMVFRRVVARRKRKIYQNVWPIDEAAARRPEGWPGWPDGKKFAFVLTHDVEGQGGLEKCDQLMQLERELGFRSSFNLIPEGGYEVSRELRNKLVQNGFEVGVHDLRHDGKLYWTRQAFSENAKKINRYLKEWGATGFRSGFMLHKLNWLRDLDIQYDASTFDTDPFEPQPDGVGTIFPFWVPGTDDNTGITGRESHDTPGRSRPGYVELPYTLVQDSTLFLSLCEPTPEIWFRKLDWIVQHGGMALLNLHPDYIRFDGEPASASTFPVAHYRKLLEYVREKYGDVAWHVLPNELAAWYRRQLSESVVEAQGPSNLMNHNETGSLVAASLKGKYAAVVLYGPYPSDPRPRRELQALLDEGMSVDLICLREDPSEPVDEVLGQLRVTRAPMQHERSGKARYIKKYATFFLRAFALLSVRSLKRRYDLVHVHNMPDLLVFSALVPRLLGAKIILDLHDPMPEVYQTIFQLDPEAGMVRLLKRLENWSIRFADLVLTPNEAFRKQFCSRSCPAAKIQIIMNTPDENIFRSGSNGRVLDTNPSQPREFRLMFHGTIAKRHGLTTTLDAMAKLSPHLPALILDLYGENNAYTQEFLTAAKQIGLNGRIRYHGLRPLNEIPAAIQNADLGLVPNLRSPFTEINFPTRIFEYLSLGKPVIVPKTMGILDYFDETTMLFFDPDIPDDLARMIRWVYEHPAETTSIMERGREVYRKHPWSKESIRFIGLVRANLG